MSAWFEDIIAWSTEAIPDTVLRKARLLLLDSLGCIVAGLRHAEVQRLAVALVPWLPGPLRLPGIDAMLGPAGIAALAAAAMCWDEANEGLAQAHGRPALPVVPVLLASDAKLDALLRALVLGYEIGGRAGEMWRIRPGMHVDGSWHSLGAAAACAALRGGDPARAIRIAACQIPFSLYRPLACGMTGRNSYASHAALLGVLAAAAAEAGSEAPADGFEEARRLALLRDDTPACTPAGTWLIMSAYMKPFAGVRHAHYAAAAAIALREGLDTRDIQAIRLAIYAEALRYAANRAPVTPIAAQFSLSFAVAAGLLFGDLGPDAYRALHDAELRRLEGLVQLSEDTTMTAQDRRAARLKLELANGTTREIEIGHVAGDAAAPMSDAEIEQKFLRFAGHLPGAGRLAEAVLRGPVNLSLPSWT
jgi:2-methylcitrate dehydratase PrpD